MDRRIIYTAIIGDYDNLNEVENPTTGWEYICYTNNPNLKSESWKIKHIDIEGTLGARFVKILPPFIYDDNWSQCIWVDGNVSIHTNLNEFVEKYCKGNISVMKHRHRNCIYRESQACIYLRKEIPWKIEKQVNTYANNGYPEDNGLLDSKLLYRINNENIIDLSEFWWVEIKTKTVRDQLSFNYVVWREDFKVHYFPYNVMYGRFLKHSHKKNRGMILDRRGIINGIIKKNNYKSYLEIGIQKGMTFKGIECPIKVGIDPHWLISGDQYYHNTSDEFFKDNQKKFDIIFIDGLADCDQFKRDIMNSLNSLKDGGTIICHNINPKNEQMQRVPRETPDWTGDCWKTWVELRRTRKDLSMRVLDQKFGYGLIKNGGQKLLDLEVNSYEDLTKNKEIILNLISADEFINLYL